MNKALKSLLALGIASAINSTSVVAATYEVVDLLPESPGTEVTHESSLGKKLNDNGDAVFTAKGKYNLPVLFDRLSILDYLSILQLSITENTVTYGVNFIEDYSSLLLGEPSGNDLYWVTRYLQVQATDSNYQKISDDFAFSYINGISRALNIWDENFSDDNAVLTESTFDQVNGISEQSWLYGAGSAPYKETEFTYIDSSFSEQTATNFIRAFDLKAFISTDAGQTKIAVEGPAGKYGGISSIADIKESDVAGEYYAVGYASVSYVESFLNAIEKNDGVDPTYPAGTPIGDVRVSDLTADGCLDPDNSNFNSAAACIQNLRTGLYRTHAYLWHMDSVGNLISEKDLGLLVQPHKSDLRNHTSQAVAVNSSGVAVGYATGWLDDNRVTPDEDEITSSYVDNSLVSSYGVVYKNDKVYDVTEDHLIMPSSILVDINNAGIAVGYATKSISGVSRTKFFYVDTTIDFENEKPKMVFPSDFYTSSSSQPKAINDNGFVVGEGEIERNLSGDRRRSGFLFDMTTGSFSNLNDFLPCGSDYNIISASDINNHNEIIATALVKTERRDAKGALVVDADTGEQLYEEVIKAVKLNPIDDGVLDTNCDAIEGNLIKRQGASFSWLSLLLLSGIAFRRKYS